MPGSKTKSEEGAKKKKEVVINPPFKVAGIGGDLEDLILNGKDFRAQVNLGVQAATLKRTVEGADTIDISVRDPERRFLNHPMFEDPKRKPVGLELDGLHFRYVQMGKSGKVSSPTFENREIAWLRKYKGPRKAFRGKTTRAEFVLSLIRTVKEGKIPVFIPELHKVQPIESDRQQREVESEKETRGPEPGLGQGDVGRVTVKHEKAHASEVKIIDTVLDVGMSMGANLKVLTCSIMTITQETHAQNIAITSGPNGEGFGPFSQTAAWRDAGYPGGTNDVAECARGFFQVCMKIDQQNPGMPHGDLCQAVQNSAYPGLYSQWQSEAVRTVEMYLGGANADGDSVSQTVIKPYAFEVKKNEDYWTAIKRLAKDVNWRAYFVNGRFFFVSEDDLYRGQVRLQFNEDSPGIDEINFDVDDGKVVHEATVIAHAKRWAVPPGMVVRMGDLGPANGRWLVSSIEGSLLPGEARKVEITLKKPSAAKPEPSPETESSSVDLPGGALSGDAPEKVLQIINWIDEATEQGPGYVWGGGHGSFGSPSSGKDCSGFVSAAVHVAGYLSTPLTSGEFANVFPNGEGEWVTIYGDAGHVFMKVKYPDGHWRYAGTGGSTGAGGWVDENNGTSGAPARSGMTASHPEGL